ncbi:MAG: RNA 2',3'-cyclic phosphodiesterase [Candidatus Aenigmarchaeota archaeon ex4484_56]|nr:MAG: RNA 2',3'-cyclic phosphodiesterase [Candidatus Aenigmarchaeota archaeon ex4484_56]
MRCFIAINIPEKIKSKIGNLLSIFENRGVKKVKPENFHITLKFLGEINNIEEIDKLLREINYKKFKVCFGDMGIFPNFNFIRVVWIGIESGKKEITELQNMIENKLVGFKKEKNYEPHLTIFRVKYLTDKNKFIEQIRNIKLTDCFIVESFDLMKSDLNKEGPIYTKLKSYYLAD